MNRKLTPAEDDVIAEWLANMRKFTLKRIRAKFRVDKMTLYRAENRAKNRRNRAILVTSVG